MNNSLLSLRIGLAFIHFFIFNQLLLAQNNNINRLKDSVFYLPNGEVIALSNGRYQNKNTTFVLHKTLVKADINNDQLKDFFVILTELHQGIQVNNYIAVSLGNSTETFANVDSLMIDNQIDLKNMTFKDKILTVEFLTYSPHQQKRLKYQFDNNSNTLVPLTIETEKKPQESLIIERDVNNIDNNNRIEIQF